MAQTSLIYTGSQLKTTMSTINGKPFSTPNNVNLKKGILRFGATQTSNPLDSSSYGLYVNASGSLIYSNAGTTTTIGAAGSGGGAAPSWDAIFQGDQTMQLGALATFTIDRNSGNNDVLTITNTGAGSGDCIQITNVGTGNDIEGTSDTWHFTKAGDMTANMAVFAGDAGSNSLTLTAGDVVVSDGSVTITDADNATSFSLTNDTATSAAVFVLAGSGTFTGSTTTSFVTITPSGLTTGTAVYLPVAAMTTGTALDIVANAITTGKALQISSSAAGTQLTGAGRLFYVNHSGVASGTGIVAEITSAAADETTIAKITASGALALGTCLAVSASSLTTGSGITIADIDSLTTGIGLHIASSATAIATTGRLLYVNHTGATSTSGILTEFATSATDETTVVKITTASMIDGIALNIVGTTGMTTGSLIRATTSTAGAVATNGIYSFKSTGAFTSTSNAGLVDIGATATTAGTVVHITSSSAGQTATSLLYVEASGFTTGYTGDVATFKSSSTTGDASVVAISSANTTDGQALKVTSAATTTNGKAIEVIAEGLTTGTGIIFAHTTSVIADGGSMLRLTDSGVATGGATNGTMLDIQSTGSVAGTLVKLYSNVASQTATTILDITQAGATLTAYTDDIVAITGGFSGNSSTGNVLKVTSVNTTAGNAVQINASALTTGTGLLVTSAGVIITTGELVSLVANSATTSTGVLRLSATALTDGWCAEFTGGGAAFTASGGMLNLQMGAATAGTGINITTSGVYTGTTGLLDINAASATTGTVVDIGAAGLTSGVALKINAVEATLTTGFYIQCYDGAASDFTVGKYGATVIAGNAVGTAALTVNAGDLVLTSGTITFRDKTEVVTETNTIAAAESGRVYFLDSATEFDSVLPAPAAGLHFTFIVKTAPSGANYTISTDSSANIIKGTVHSSTGGNADSSTGEDTINFVDGQAVAGDMVEVWCDGTNWFAKGYCDADGGITFTTAS